MDPFQQAAAEIGTDFEAYLALAAGVTVAQVDPDTGAATATVANVPALKRSRRRQPFEVAAGGELGDDECRFVFRLGALARTPKARDRVTDADGLVWVVERVALLAFDQLVAVDVTLER
jgi:hypothetical protein